MDFFERYLGFSGGRGDGTLEGMLLLVLVIIITGIAMGFWYKHYERNEMRRERKAAPLRKPRKKLSSEI